MNFDKNPTTIDNIINQVYVTRRFEFINMITIAANSCTIITNTSEIAKKPYPHAHL